MSIVIDSSKHLIPGYSLYKAGQSLQSDAPFAIKVRDALMASSISFAHLYIATESAMKIQAVTGSASGNLARSWMTISRLLPLAWTAPAMLATVFAALVVYTGMNEPSRTDTSLNIPYRSMSGRHHGNPYLS